MNNKTKSAFVVCVSGERYIEYRKNLVDGMAKYVPDVPVVDLDPKKVVEMLSPMTGKNAIKGAWLAIPMIEELRRYDRVIWLDVDTDVTTERFSEILNVETSEDGLAACPDDDQTTNVSYMRDHYPEWKRNVFMNTGVIVFDLNKIEAKSWKEWLNKVMGDSKVEQKDWRGKDILNLCFECAELDAHMNWTWSKKPDSENGAYLVHYSKSTGHDMLDEVLMTREKIADVKSWKDRCVVVSPRHAFIRPWIRAYFATGNMTPLVIVPGPPGDWKDGDMEYCQAAAKFCGGLVFDCSQEWENSKRLAARAVRKNNVGWFTKKSILHAVAKRLAPKSWAWIDDDAEVTGLLDECFTHADRSPGFILTQFYYPNSIDNCHPERTYRSNIDTGDKICWNSLVFFHGEANARIVEELGKDFPVEDDEIVFCNLYQNNPVWHEGFCDYSIRNWQLNCKYLKQIPARFDGKLIHYTSTRNNGELKKMWAKKADILRKAPFEHSSDTLCDQTISDSDPIDAVFVIGTGSIDENEELRYALRNLESHCKFVRNVYICGFCPSWVDRSVVKHLQWPDRFSHAKDANIIDKLRHACEQPGIAKRILFCSDDQFQTHECTWEDFAPRYLRRYESNDGWYENRRRVWHTRLHHTLERDAQRRRSVGMSTNDVFYYQPHIWMPIDRDLFIDYARWCGYERRDDTIIASGYYNYANVQGIPDFDHVFISDNATDIPDATHVAYHDGSYHAAMRILKKMFPERSRFELSSERMKRPSAHVEVKKPSPIVARSADIIASDDPAPANADERSELLDVMARIRNNPVWHGLMGEVSRAEELRLFGVRGWRIVWKDIVSRWRDTTCGGTDLVPVDTKRSDEAASILNAYMQNPDSLRTVHFGPQTIASEAHAFVPGRQLPRPASLSARESLRGRIRSLR